MVMSFYAGDGVPEEGSCDRPFAVVEYPEWLSVAARIEVAAECVGHEDENVYVAIFGDDCQT